MLGELGAVSASGPWSISILFLDIKLPHVVMVVDKEHQPSGLETVW